jgi:DNA-binding LytR/AlgR family response regulator
MHYTAMAGLMIMPHEMSSGAPALSTDLLAIVVAVVAFIVSGVFFLTLVPERPAATPAPATETAPAASRDAALADATPAAADLGQGSFAPLGGAGGPPRRAARQLPVEKDGITHFVAVDDIVAIHANAHYTYLYDGTAKLFCPLAIGDVESRLDASRFVRVHRSHIINIDRVVGLRRSGDNGVVELAGAAPYAVPVSRSRVAWLKARIGTKLGAVAS